MRKLRQIYVNMNNIAKEENIKMRRIAKTVDEFFSDEDCAIRFDSNDQPFIDFYLGRNGYPWISYILEEQEDYDDGGRELIGGSFIDAADKLKSSEIEMLLSNTLDIYKKYNIFSGLYGSDGRLIYDFVNYLYEKYSNSSIKENSANNKIEELSKNKTTKTMGDDNMKTTTNLFGLKNGVIENSYNIQLDIEGNLGLKNRYVRQTGSIAELSTLNNDYLKLLAITVPMETLKIGDLILDSTSGKPMFVSSIDRISEGEITLQDIENDNKYDRNPIKNAVLKKVMMVKLVNLYSFIGDENLAEIVPLMTYGEDRVMSILVNQIIRTGKVNILELEMELNPLKAQQMLTIALTNFVNLMGTQPNKAE